MNQQMHIHKYVQSHTPFIIIIIIIIIIHQPVV
jgi:hypothetical protein